MKKNFKIYNCYFLTDNFEDIKMIKIDENIEISNANIKQFVSEKINAGTELVEISQI